MKTAQFQRYSDFICPQTFSPYFSLCKCSCYCVHLCNLRLIISLKNVEFGELEDRNFLQPAELWRWRLSLEEIISSLSAGEKKKKSPSNHSGREKFSKATGDQVMADSFRGPALKLRGLKDIVDSFQSSCLIYFSLSSVLKTTDVLLSS